jgi:hypothetical protein
MRDFRPLTWGNEYKRIRSIKYENRDEAGSYHQRLQHYRHSDRLILFESRRKIGRLAEE